MSPLHTHCGQYLSSVSVDFLLLTVFHAPRLKAQRKGSLKTPHRPKPSRAELLVSVRDAEVAPDAHGRWGSPTGERNKSLRGGGGKGRGEEGKMGIPALRILLRRSIKKSSHL